MKLTTTATKKISNAMAIVFDTVELLEIGTDKQDPEEMLKYVESQHQHFMENYKDYLKEKKG